ncbi:MAG: MATE family efflux transporter [bacterium]
MQNIKQNLKETIKLAIPLSLGQFGHILMGIVDTIMVGGLGAASLAAAAVVNSVFAVLMVSGIGISLAITPLAAVEKGAKRTGEFSGLLSNSLIINVSFSFIFAVLLYFGAGVLGHLNQPFEVVKAGIPYLKIVGLSIIPIMVFQTYRQFLEGISDAKPPMYINLLANIANAFLNWVLIYGKFGFPEMGLNGAGLATLFTRTLMAISLYLYVRRSKKYSGIINKFSFKAYDISKIKKLLSIGIPSGLQLITEVSAFSFIGIMIGWIGTIELAAHQIALNLASATFMVMLGISAAGTIRVGNAVGEKNNNKIRSAGFSSIILCVGIMFLFALLLILFKDILPYIYINDYKVVKVVSRLIIIAAIFQIFDGLQAASAGVLRGLTDVKVPMFVIFAAYWLIGIPFGAYLCFYANFSLYGIWIGIVAALIFVGSVLFLRFNKLSKDFIE